MRSKLLLTVVLSGMLLSASDAAACPMCKAANEAAQSDGGTGTADANLRPRAYMYSIFFMMSMPPIAAGVIATAIYRDVKRARLAAVYGGRSY